MAGIGPRHRRQGQGAGLGVVEGCESRGRQGRVQLGRYDHIGRSAAQGAPARNPGRGPAMERLLGAGEVKTRRAAARRYPFDMTHFRVNTLRALALSLALAAACPAQAQTTPTAGPAAARQPDAAAVARADEQRKQVAVALGKSDELASAGKFDADIALLEDAEKKIPGDALIASALGTAFELKGQLGDALDWIREGIKRDAGAHKGSEWLHARILEAKLALAKDPKWFDKHNVLGLDFGKDEVPVAPEILPIEQGRIKGAEQLLDQIDYQLVERTKNSRPPNPVLG